MYLMLNLSSLLELHEFITLLARLQRNVIHTFHYIRLKHHHKHQGLLVLLNVTKLM